MTHGIDMLLVGVLVLAALCYAVYALGPAKLKTWVLAQIGRVFGLRVLGLLVRKSASGCQGCSAAAMHPTVEKPKPGR